MRFKSPVRFVAMFALFTVGMLWLSGCLEATESIVGRYDADKDQFVFLNLYQRIGAEKPEDLEYLQALYQNRDHLLTPPLPDILGKTSLVRLSDKSFAAINLGSRSDALEPKDSPLSLNQIKVLPGQFYLRGPDALCYYDQVVIPGSFVDEGIKLGMPELTKNFSAGAQAEIQRRKDGGKTIAWAELRANLVKKMEKPENAPPPPDVKPGDAAPAEDETDPIKAISGESLQLLSDQAAGRMVELARAKSVFTVTIPLTDADANESIATVQFLRAAIATYLKKPDHKKDFEIFALLTEPIEAKAIAGKGLQMSVDAVALFPRVQKAMDPVAELSPADAGAAERYKTAVDTIRAKGLPISESMTTPQVLADFQAGKLAANLSAKPVTPGEGLFKK